LKSEIDNPPIIEPSSSLLLFFPLLEVKIHVQLIVSVPLLLVCVPSKFVHVQFSTAHLLHVSIIHNEHVLIPLVLLYVLLLIPEVVVAWWSQPIHSKFVEIVLMDSLYHRMELMKRM
jgi:hypothetical protein